MCHNTEENICCFNFSMSLIILRNFFHYKELFCTGKIPWLLKVLHGAIDVNKEPLFKSAWTSVDIHCFFKMDFSTSYTDL